MCHVEWEEEAVTSADQEVPHLDMEGPHSLPTGRPLKHPSLLNSCVPGVEPHVWHGQSPTAPSGLAGFPWSGLAGDQPFPVPAGTKRAACNGLRQEGRGWAEGGAHWLLKEHKTEGIAMGSGNFPELSGLCSHRSMYLQLQEELHAFTHTLCCIWLPGIPWDCRLTAKRDYVLDYIPGICISSLCSFASGFCAQVCSWCYLAPSSACSLGNQDELGEKGLIYLTAQLLWDTRSCPLSLHLPQQVHSTCELQMKIGCLRNIRKY